MTTYVLVHGAWHGAWCWQKVRTALEAGGAEVHTPTLTAPPQLKTFFEGKARIAGDRWLVPVSVATPQFLCLTSEEEVNWVIPKLTPHPIRTCRESARLAGQFPQKARSFINCIGDKAFGQPRSTQAEGIEDYHELRSGHDAMVTVPQDVATLLRKIAP